MAGKVVRSKPVTLEDLAAKARSRDKQATSKTLTEQPPEDLAARVRSEDLPAPKHSKPKDVIEENRRSLKAFVQANAALMDGMAALSTELLEFGHKRLDANFERSQSLVACEDAEQALRVHSEFIESAVRQYRDQANSVMKLMASINREFWAPLEEQTKKNLRELNKREAG